MDSPSTPNGVFDRFDDSSDENFYAQPRFVTHIEAPTIAAVTQLYRELLPQGGTLLDLMSSWVSHLPDDMSFARVVGLGLNRDELAANRRLDAFHTRNLNRNPQLPLPDAAFDAAVCCVSVQYLTQPVAVMREVARVCIPGAPFVISFSNRCFPSKAVLIWQNLDDAGRLELVARYLEASGGWGKIEKLDRTPQGASEPLLAVVARRL